MKKVTNMYKSCTSIFNNFKRYFNLYINPFALQHHLEKVQERGYALEQKSYRIANGSISNKILEIRWPLGVPPPSAPETRHDILTWQLLNGTHSFLPHGNAEHAVAPLSKIEALDFAKVLEIALQYAALKHPRLSYHSLHSAYRKFDATRGMDYQLHLSLQEGSGRSRRLVVKSFEVVKPLGRVEVVPGIQWISLLGVGCIIRSGHIFQ